MSPRYLQGSEDVIKEQNRLALVHREMRVCAGVKREYGIERINMKEDARCSDRPQEQWLD